PGIMARFTCVKASGKDPAATRTLASPARGTSSSQSQVHATVMSGSAPVESASASAAWATSNSATRRAAERSRSASAAIASATRGAEARPSTPPGGLVECPRPGTGQQLQGDVNQQQDVGEDHRARGGAGQQPA